jgi:DNA-binding NtrC family response regulator
MAGVKSALIVMNDPSQVWAIAQDLIRNGLSVTATVSGRDGFQQLERHEFGYLILDGCIEEVSLLTFMEYCRRYLPGSVTIVLTDISRAITPEKVQIAGAKYCVSGPQYREVISDIIFGLDAAQGNSSINPGTG